MVRDVVLRNRVGCGAAAGDVLEVVGAEIQPKAERRRNAEQGRLTLPVSGSGAADAS